MKGSLLAMAVLVVAGCAHATAPKTALRTAAKPKTMMVTGSHIPQPVDEAGKPAAGSSEIRVYSRGQLDETGRSYDTGSALQQLDPSL